MEVFAGIIIGYIEYLGHNTEQSKYYYFLYKFQSEEI